ncbi:MAG: hypothetical protein NPIRA05_12430 [Nitrospirales bacterium]|nr:MAG: hypothetical protein NPIRA05_12430 [Nitrospirales bacterium]
MAEWLRQPGFVGTHATMGADVSQLMAAVFTTLFIIGWVQARKGEGTKHHWLMFGGMIAMLSFFVSYYLFRNLGVLAFEGKEGFGGSQWLYDTVFVPILTFHIILVVIGLIMAVYMIVLGFRTQFFSGARRLLREQVLLTAWTKMLGILGVLAGLVAAYLLTLVALDRFGMGKLVVWVSLLVIIGIVMILEMSIQRMWPNGARRHRVLGQFTMVVYCVLFVTGSVTYAMLYILYPGKIG